MGESKLVRRLVVYAVLLSALLLCFDASFLLKFSSKKSNPAYLPSISESSLSSQPWPPLKVYVYPNNSRHTIDCLYPPEMPLRYVDERNFWFQRMLEPTIHVQYLKSPIRTQDPSEADLFFIPHYSRMCSGLDNGERFHEIPQYLSSFGKYFERYSGVDHFLAHSVPHYGDKPADAEVGKDTSMIIGILDFKWVSFLQKPWAFARNIVMPFITLPSKSRLESKREYMASVAMSKSKSNLGGGSAYVRQNIVDALENRTDVKIIGISRRSLQSFQSALSALPDMMGSSQFCIVPPGDAPSSKRFYDAISHFCVPLLVTDKFTLPYDGLYVDYEKCAVQLPIANISAISNYIDSFTLGKIGEKRVSLIPVRKMFTWDYKKAPRAGEALWTLSWALYDRIHMLKPYMNNELTGYEGD